MSDLAHVWYSQKGLRLEEAHSFCEEAMVRAQMRARVIRACVGGPPQAKLPRPEQQGMSDFEITWMVRDGVPARETSISALTGVAAILLGVGILFAFHLI